MRTLERGGRKENFGLTDLTRTSLLHATARLPKAISVQLWPYWLLTANNVLCSIPKRPDGVIL